MSYLLILFTSNTDMLSYIYRQCTYLNYDSTNSEHGKLNNFWLVLDKIILRFISHLYIIRFNVFKILLLDYSKSKFNRCVPTQETCPKLGRASVID